MRRVRLTIGGPTLEVHPVFGPLTDPSVVDRAEALYWNVADDGAATVLSRIEGEIGALASAFEAAEPIEAVEWIPAGDATLAYVRDRGTDVSRALLRTFTRDGLLVVPPVVYENGCATVTAVGDPAVLQAAHDGLPDGLSVTVDGVGDAVGALDPTAALTDRQLAAARVGLELGYFDVPRRASHADVAAELDCSPSTAAEHLQKAQATLVRRSLTTAGRVR